eukprot:3055236-Ditylum_brightwellii.AAC.1
MPNYDDLLAFIDLDITAATVEKPEDATDSGFTNQLCDDLKAGLNKAIHLMNSLWEEHGEESNWGILLVDAWNAFNKVNQRAMLWSMHHAWAA